MADETITKTELNQVIESLKEIKGMLNDLLDPKEGIYPQIHDIKGAAKRAHERIDNLYDHKNKLEEDKLGDRVRELEGFKKTLKKGFLWVLIGIATPILGGIGLYILNKFGG